MDVLDLLIREHPHYVFLTLCLVILCASYLIARLAACAALALRGHAPEPAPPGPKKNPHAAGGIVYCDHPDATGDYCPRAQGCLSAAECEDFYRRQRALFGGPAPPDRLLKLCDPGPEGGRP
jgi:hypothetical protein